MSWGELVATHIVGDDIYNTYNMTEDGSGITILRNHMPILLARFNLRVDSFNIVQMPGKEILPHLNNRKVY